MRRAIIYNKKTKEIGATIQVTMESDLELNVNEEEGFIEIPGDHPYLVRPQDEWEIIEDTEGRNKLQSKSVLVIENQRLNKEREKWEAQKLEKKRQFIDMYISVLKEINELRIKLNMPIKTIDEIYTETYK